MDQFGLFGDTTKEEIINYDGQCFYYPNFIEENYYDEILAEIIWRQDQITLFGKTHNVPRLHAWYNDNDKSYTYSNIKLPVNKFGKCLATIREIIATKTGIYFDSCLCNLYRNGDDYAAIHADDEPELGVNPVIASISLGVQRKFVFKHKFNKGIEKVSINLEDKSLLLMKGSLQHNWKHELPRSKKIKDPRINLTFRQLANL